MADRSVDIDPSQYIPVSNDPEDCSLEPKACPEPSHACPDARAYPQRRPGSLRRTRFPGGDTGGHLRTGRIEPGGVQLQFPVQGGAVFRHLRSDDRTIERLERHLEISTASAQSRPGPAAENFVRAFIADYAFDRSWYLLQADFGLHALRNPAVASHYAARQNRILSVIEEAVGRVWRGIEPSRPHASSRVARLILAVHEGAMFQRLLEPSTIKDGELLTLFADLLFSKSAINS